MQATKIVTRLEGLRVRVRVRTCGSMNGVPATAQGGRKTVPASLAETRASVNGEIAGLRQRRHRHAAVGRSSSLALMLFSFFMDFGQT